MDVSIQLKFREKDYLSGEGVDERKRQEEFHGCGRESYLVRNIVLETRGWLKCG